MGAALAPVVLLASAGVAPADEIGALDSFFRLDEAEILTPAPLTTARQASLMAPQGGRPATGPRAELLLDEAQEPGATILLSEAARRSLGAEPVTVALGTALQDPLARAEPAPSGEADPGDPQTGGGPDLLSRVFAGAAVPLQDALRRHDDPIHAGALLASAREAALAPQPQTPAPEAAPPLAAMVESDPDALGRRMLLIALGLLAGGVVVATFLFSFAPSGGSTLKRR